MKDHSDCSTTGPQSPEEQDEVDADDAQDAEDIRDDTLARLLALLRTGCWPVPRMQPLPAANL